MPIIRLFSRPHSDAAPVRRPRPRAHGALVRPGAALVVAAAVAAAVLPPAPARADLQFRALQDRSLLLDPLSPPPVEGLPPSWAWVVPPPIYEAGGARVLVTYDPERGTVEERYQEGNVEVRPPMVASGPDYYELLSDRSYHKVWRERTRTTRSVNRDGLRRGGLFQVDIPIQLPKAVRSIVGDGAPNITVSGSERIAIVGTSDWTVQNDIYQNLTGERKRQGAFPSFEMKQELNVNLTGSIGDKIKVDVDQSSNVSTSIDNRVKLRYEGDDDDMIQTIELGNTNLSLQGASLRQEGLFGVKTVMKLGNFDITTIASKQDAKTETARFTPSGETRTVRIADLDYIPRRYFFIADHPLPERDLGLRLFVSSSDVQRDPPGVARLDPLADSSATNPQYRSHWRELTLGTDYDVEYPYTLTNAEAVRIPVIRLRFSVSEGQLLAAAYRDGQQDVGSTTDPNNLLLKVLKARASDYTVLPSGLIDPAGPWFPVLDYELKNHYDLQGSDIDPSSLSIKIRRKDGGAATDPDEVLGQPLVQVLGLDQRSKTGEFSPDGLVDDEFVRVAEGILWFPDLHPFAPVDTSLAGTPCDPGLGGFLCLDDYSRNLLAQADTLANDIVYKKQSLQAFQDDRYYIEAQFRSSQQVFSLGRFGILENSEQVKVDGIPQRRDVDYRIDYTTGQLTFVNPPSPEAVITADFSYPPGFGQVQRTLLGLSGAYNPASNLSFSTSLLHESRGAQEQNPRLGEEPARSTLGDFGAVLSFRPVWMTRLADQVPGITTDQPSALNIQGNLSASVPNPNTNGEAYIDDMEGNRESNTVGLSRLQWFWSSIPKQRYNPRDLMTDQNFGEVIAALENHAQLEWYNPRPESRTAAKEHDLKPDLKDEEGGDNNHQVLEWNIKQSAADSLNSWTNEWTGLTQSISATGTDFSYMRFVEIWVNDFTKNHNETNALLHLSIGRVSEDAFWNKREMPNGRLDTEDKNRDGILDGGDPKSPNFEDTGFDGVVSELEPGYDPTTPAGRDPSDDDYRYNVRDNPDDYSTINNLEFNGIGEANARPDTEDLNRDNFFDQTNSYFETTIDLADTRFVEIDVPSEYAGNPNVKDNNGWRLFRIPVTGETFRSIGSPSWQNVQHVRLWVSHMDRPMTLQIGGIEFVGSRWLTAAIDSTRAAQGLRLDVSSINNKDNADEYTPPYEVRNQAGGTADQREQSLALNYTGVVDGDLLLAFKTLGTPGTGLGWAQYREIKFYLHGGERGDDDVAGDGVRAIARFQTDTLNYYEYSVPIERGWKNVTIPMDLLSRLKETRPRTERVWSDPAIGAPAIYTVVGNPSFTRITRVTFGVTKGADPAITAPVTVSGANSLPVSITGSASDPDGDTVILSQTNDAPFLAGPASAGPSLSPSITLSGTPSQAGSYTITWSAVATSAGAATAKTTLTITSGNQASVITAPATVSLAEHWSVSITGSASDPDGDNVTLSQTNDAPFLTGPASAGPALNPSVTLTGAPSSGQAGSYAVTWLATDEGSAETTTTKTTLTVASATAEGEVWINELRLADVRKDAGMSANLSVQASFADLIAINLSVQKQDEDFSRVGQGANQGTGLNHTAVGFSTTLQMDRFLPTSGVQLPIRYSMQHSTDVPKFRTGSDVSLDAARSEIETRRLDRQTIDISYRRSSSIRRGISKYTLDALSGTMAYSRSSSVNPQSRDSTWSFSSSASYDLPVGGGGFSLGKSLKVNLLPEVVGFSAGWSSSRSVNYSRTIFNEGDSTALRSDAKVRLLTLGTTTSWVPLSSFRVQYALTSQRDMLQRQEGGLGFNKGTEIDHLQTVSVNWTPRWLALFGPNVNLRARYHEDSRPERRIAQTDPFGLKNIDNQGSANVRFSLPLSKLGTRAVARRRSPADSARGGGISPLAPVRYVLGKFQDIQTNFNFDRGATLTRVTGDPGFAFKSGFSQVTDPGLNRFSGSVFATSRRYTTNLSTAFRPTTTLTVDVRADHGLSLLDQTFGARRTERFQWPDLKGRWVDLHRLVGLGNTLKSLTLQSSFAKTTEKEGPADGPIERRTNTRTFGPLLGWDVVFQNNIRASLTSSITKATTLDLRTAGLTRNRQTTSTEVRLNKTFPASKGIKLPFKKERIRLPNDLNLNLTVGLQSDYATSIRSGERPYIETDTGRLNVSSGTTYNFSRTVSGGFNFAYRQTDNKKQSIKQRGISIEFNAQFAF